MMGPLRSLLFVPATRPDRFDKAIASGADAVILDLEDSVEPRRKTEARGIAADALARYAASNDRGRVFVRVNPYGGRWFHDDVTRLRHVEPAAVVLPKCESTEAVEAVIAAMPGIAVVPIIETARGVLQAAAIAASGAAIPALMFGAEDLTAELGIPRTLEGDELLFARSQVVLAAATVGAAAIDAVWIHITDVEGLRRDAARARALGFAGKMAIHPAQVPVIHDVFTPTAAELDDARAIVAAYDAAVAAGEGVVRLNDRMVDEPVVRRARRVVAANGVRS
jgi:citrate lyase beta subunit